MKTKNQNTSKSDDEILKEILFYLVFLMALIVGLIFWEVLT